MSNYTPGDTYTMEFGLAKTLKPGMDIGLVGYWQQQVTNGSADLSPDESIVALGPELTAVCPKLGTSFSLRYLREFSAKQHPEGNKLVLTLTKRF